MHEIYRAILLLCVILYTALYNKWNTVLCNKCNIKNTHRNKFLQQDDVLKSDSLKQYLWAVYSQIFLSFKGHFFQFC